MWLATTTRCAARSLRLVLWDRREVLGVTLAILNQVALGSLKTLAVIFFKGDAAESEGMADLFRAVHAIDGLEDFEILTADPDIQFLGDVTANHGVDGSCSMLAAVAVFLFGPVSLFASSLKRTIFCSMRGRIFHLE